MVGGQFASRDSHGTVMHDFYSFWSVHKDALKEERNPTVTRKTYAGARMAYLIHPGILEDALSLLSAFYTCTTTPVIKCADVIMRQLKDPSDIDSQVGSVHSIHLRALYGISHGASFWCGFVVVDPLGNHTFHIQLTAVKDKPTAYIPN